MAGGTGQHCCNRVDRWPINSIPRATLPAAAEWPEPVFPDLASLAPWPGCSKDLKEISELELHARTSAKCQGRSDGLVRMRKHIVTADEAH